MDLAKALSELTEEQVVGLAEELNGIRESAESEDLKNSENEQN